MSHSNDGQNFCPGKGQLNAAAPVLSLDQGDYRKLICSALRRAFGTERHGISRLAEAANTNIDTAKNWMAGRCTPGGLHLLKLIASEPVFQGEIRRITGMRDDLDPELDRDISALVQRYMERRR